MASEVVLYEKEGPLAIITVNRPEARNALNAAVFLGIDAALDRIAADDEIRVVIVTGAGGNFGAGADIGELLGYDTKSGWAASRFDQSVFTKLEELGKPSIAAIKGFAVGGALELALSCTFRIASVKSKLGFPELGLGIITAFGGTERAVRTVGHAKASELILFRSIVDGGEAYRIGLVNVSVEPDQVMAKAKEWPLNLASLSPVAVRLELELLLEGQNGSINQGLALESALGSLAVSSPEAKELLQRFVDKSR
jgi:enoyl-CoA hydratase